MDIARIGAGVFFQNYGFLVFMVVLALVGMALVRADLHLVATPAPNYVTYRLYETMVEKPEAAFCNAHPDLQVREKDCNELSEGVCKDAGCCVWADISHGQSACVAGDRHGPVYLSDPHSENMYDVTRYVHRGETYSNRRAAN